MYPKAKAVIKTILGFFAIASISVIWPFAYSNLEVHNHWLVVALSVPPIIVIAWFMTDAF